MPGKASETFAAELDIPLENIQEKINPAMKQIQTSPTQYLKLLEDLHQVILDLFTDDHSWLMVLNRIMWKREENRTAFDRTEDFYQRPIKQIVQSFLLAMNPCQISKIR